jgi:cyclase
MSLSRRDFLGTSALGLLAAGFPHVLSAAAYPRLALPRSIVELRRNVGIFTSRGGTMGWLANARGALVVDSQFPDTAATFADGFRERGTSAFDALLNTHHHGDHTGGNGVFRESARHIVAHANVPTLQRRAAEASGAAETQTYADTTFDVEWRASIGDETVRAKHYGPAHTGGDATVFFEQADIVHMGDLVFNRVYPFVDRAGGASMRGWVYVLEAVAAEHSADTIYIFGHARPGFEVTGGRADVLLQRDLLSAVLETAERAVAAGRSREDAMAAERLPGFDEHEPINARLTLGAVIGVAWDELTGA